MPIARNEFDEQWQSRLARAHELRDQFPNAAGLDFYEAVLQFQAALSSRRRQAVKTAMPLRDQIDVFSLSPEMPALLDLVAARGPELLRTEARKLAEAGGEAWRELLVAALSQENSLDPIHGFFPRACLQPAAENLQLQMDKDPHYVGSICPKCGGLPQMAALKPEGEGASRSLVCSFCFYEWSFRRVICPSCGEEDKEQLPRYSSEEWNYLHVEACETCKHYLKAVDLSVNGLAVPLVDEAALAVLDVWPRDRGYTKIVPNLIGF